MARPFLLWAEADDVMAAFTPFVQSREPFDMWSKEQVLDMTGIDRDEPPPEVPEVRMDRSAPASFR